jgi:pyruvate kinase
VTGSTSEAMRVTAAMTGAAWRAAMEERAAAIVACTRSGMTARAIARFRPPMPIMAITPRPMTARQLRTSWGINEIVISEASDINELTDVAIAHLKRANLVQEGDVIVLLAGSLHGGAATTDTVRMVIVP